MIIKKNRCGMVGINMDRTHTLVSFVKMYRPWRSSYTTTRLTYKFPVFVYQAYIWDLWHELVEPYATLMPYMVGVGNHEQDHIWRFQGPQWCPGWWLAPLVGELFGWLRGRVWSAYVLQISHAWQWKWTLVVCRRSYFLTISIIIAFRSLMFLSSAVSQSCSQPYRYLSGREHPKMLLFSQSLKVRVHNAVHLDTKDGINNHAQERMILSSPGHMNPQLAQCSKLYLT